MDRENLAAVCGLYCGACEIYRVTHDDSRPKRQGFLQEFAARRGNLPQEALQCDGCLGQGRLTPWCRQCAIRLCPLNKPGVTRCSDCPAFPCSLISSFNHDGKRHHAETLGNLRRFRDAGIRDWVNQEEERWHCPQCGKSFAWYDKDCVHCGAKRPERLFPL